ncbi:hypothetical protein KGD82_02215 [Nocardiopsis eucommiae]|uniref:Uncharacterized protein n=1 Tax=Nocardiopsis eucommiae TaxID=2831970 RepID=A0A975LAX2_9ACTN|nr:hypothetical protein KGD82_02215 [Nocardiopsis eucommiae]
MSVLLSERPEPVRYRGNAYAELGDLAVEADATGTVFWEFVADDLAATGLDIGLSANPTPGLGADTTGNPFDPDDFGPHVTLDERGLVARDGAGERVLDTEITDGERYAVWLVVDNAADTYRVHVAVAGGDPVPARGPDGDTEFAFRTAGRRISARSCCSTTPTSRPRATPTSTTSTWPRTRTPRPTPHLSTPRWSTSTPTRRPRSTVRTGGAPTPTCGSWRTPRGRIPARSWR